jgi:hypothetical protein
MSARKHRVAELATERDVATDSVYDCSGNPSTMSDLRQDVSPNCYIFTAPVVEDDNRSGRNVIDIVAYRTSGLGCRPVKKREGSSRQPELVSTSLDPGTLPVDSKAIQCIAQSCAVERGCTFNISVLIHRFSISS